MASTYFDITRKLQEFGFGPSDSESDEDEFENRGDEQRQSISNDWESIGLLPSLQKLQINFRNASYSFMTGLRRESGKSFESQVDDKKKNPGLSNDYGADHTGPKPALQPTETSESAVAVKKATLVETAKTEERNALNGHVEKAANEKDEEDEDEEEDDEDEDDEEEDENDDEWEEIGRLPKLNQLPFPFRNASEFITFPSSVFSYQGEISSVSSRGLGWHRFMQNFQLPSFFDEHSDGEEALEDINDPNLADVFSEEGLTDEDRKVYYNEEGLTGCKHYLRNCKSECNQCHKFYMCQLCHDDVELHHMNRQLCRRMLCLHCQKPQPPRRTCRFCKEVMGDYYCKICKLWNDDPDKSIYHCDKCGICRVGRGPGIDVFHCDKCGICMNLVVMDNHRCIEQAANSNCPICLEDLFSTPRPTVFMPCGHPIHRECFDEYSKRYYRCPVCSKSILNTSALFRMIDEEIQYEVLPPELADKMVNILCQDCHLKSQTKFHLAGLKCETCGSYNTALL